MHKAGLLLLISAIIVLIDVAEFEGYSEITKKYIRSAAGVSAKRVLAV